MTADGVILLSALTTAASTVGTSVLPESMSGHGTLPAPRLLFGTAILFTGLSMLATFAPAFAAMLAASIAITSLTYYGLPLLINYYGGK